MFFGFIGSILKSSANGILRGLNFSKNRIPKMIQLNLKIGENGFD